jgi:hypothetical protein
MARYVTVSATGKRIPLGAYVAGVKLAKANPCATFKHGLTTWWSVTGAEIMEQFREGMHDRINQAVPYAARGEQGHG